ncbi:MAG TPA: DinB family protein [Candidatus Acidoferrales bacterium]|nr:DinB family protein [Candidatus Acidoferrales bacterium]
MSGRHRDWPAKLRIDASAYVAPGAVVVGEVTLGARASVWFNSVLRGDSAAIEIGEASNVQDLSTVHVDDGQPAIVGRRVTVGHRAIVHGCTIGDDCLIGMGAIVLSGARVGAGSLVGAGALVREGQEIPPGSLVLGAPARVAGGVTAAHREAIAAGTQHYVELAESYRRRGMVSTVALTSRGAAARPRASRPMDFLEWEQRVRALSEGPTLAAAALARHGAEAFRRRPSPGRWCALEVVCHLRDCDREVFVERLERVLADDFPAVEDVPMEERARARNYRDEDTAAAIEAWRELRDGLVSRLSPLTPEHWQRPFLHPHRGAQTLADSVRGWCDHDLSHRRQWREALGDFA